MAIIGALRSAKAIDQAQILQDDLISWLRGCNSNTDTALGVVDFLGSLGDDSGERGFEVLDILVTTLNIASFDPPDKPIKSKYYWYPELYDFRKSLAPLIKRDYEKGLQIIQRLSNKEMAMQVQASYCGEYLKMRSKVRKSTTKP